MNASEQNRNPLLRGDGTTSSFSITLEFSEKELNTILHALEKAQQYAEAEADDGREGAEEECGRFYHTRKSLSRKLFNTLHGSATVADSE